MGFLIIIIDNLPFRTVVNRKFLFYNLNDIVVDFMDFFFDKDKNFNEIFQKDLIKAFIKRISKGKDPSNKWKFNIKVLLRFFKYCVNFGLEIEKIQRIELQSFNQIKISFSKRILLNKRRDK